jgi:hypothetical protein
VKAKRAPRGQEKSEVINFRITPETKAFLKRAAEASGRTASAECEYQLRRALSYMSPGPTYAVMRTVSAALESLLALEHPKPERWLHEPELFDRTLRFFIAALEMFRPEEPPRPPNAVPVPVEFQQHHEDHDKSFGRAALLELLAQIARADPSAPMDRQSRRQRALATMKQDLGEVADRPALRELVPLAQKAVNNPEEIISEDTRELWHFIQRLATLQDRGVFDRLETERTKP